MATLASQGLSSRSQRPFPRITNG
ncbi:hypothetical protein CO2235_U1010046 [Cupriavidus oxalaticus]|uniref:Uncharacterized protein n=1 Tax=Cupriavidus oxalaticus TaxID=96344 RepID=A0A375FMT7_9BURK|nr:hypothetical protein CO2235_U1010046 [Cupriavidus oxalaticus]